METQVDRSKFIGGSDIAAILGISPWRNVVELWLDKVKPLPRDETKVQTRGKRLESYLLDMIQEEYGIIAFNRNQRYVDETVPFFGCEIDAQTAGETPEVADINIELKTVHPFKSQEWGDLQTDQLPLHYLAQVQWGLGITDREFCRVFALIGDDLKPYIVQRDNETIIAMRERAREFWEKYVIPREQPPLDYSDPGTLEVLRRLYPGTDGREIFATTECERWRQVMQDAQAQSDKYLNVVHGCKAHLLDVMGNAALMKFEDGKALRRKLIKVKGYTVADREQIDARFIAIKEESK